VATVLGKLARDAGHEVLQVYSRTAERAERLAHLLQAAPCDAWDAILPGADLYLVCLSDAGTASIAQHWQTRQGLAVHTAGALPLNTLQPAAARHGVLYPLQSLLAHRQPPESVPLLVDASTPQDLAMLQAFAQTISTSVSHSNDQQRLRLHLAAVFANNFTNHLYHLAQLFCRQQGVDFQLLHPLIRETAARLREGPPGQWQTGPALRGDDITMEKHLRLLKDQPRLEAIYLMLSDSIRQLATAPEEAPPPFEKGK
jgi:predicted short-subunit dehydrogenase-like oxidoreductase (DUF2520 family)